MPAICKNWIWILVILCLCGCRDEYVSYAFFGGEADVEAPPEVTVGPVPEDLAILLWGDLDAYIEDLEDVLDDGIIETDEGQVHDSANIMPKYFRDRIAEIRQQRAFYGKYISAGGVVIIGSQFLEDRCFYAARAVVLGMTSKMPKLRERLSPTHEARVNLTGKLAVPDSEFRMVIHDPLHTEAIPERHSGQMASIIGSCGLEFCHATTAIYEDHNGNAALSMNTFIHEFAHAIHYAMNLFDATFEQRLEAAYADVLNNPDSYWMGAVGAAPLMNWKEYWAWSSVKWFTRFSLPTKFGEQHHARFRENDPMMYALLKEFYDFKYLNDF